MTTRVRVRLLLAALLHLGVLCLAATAQVSERLPIRVRIEPIMRDPINGVAWNALIEECRRIWGPEGVEVLWLGRDDGGSPHVSLPLVFDDRELRRHDPVHEDALGVTLFQGRSQRILVSAARARRVLAGRHGLADSSDAMTLDIAFGRVLGRVVAHEIGHALLLTLTHATQGLMSPQLETTDVRPLDQGQLQLTLVERARINTRFSQLTLAAPALAGTAAENRAPAVTPITWTIVPPPSRPPVRR
jgi:hypothetical protein